MEKYSTPKKRQEPMAVRRYGYAQLVKEKEKRIYNKGAFKMGVVFWIAIGVLGGCVLLIIVMAILNMVNNTGFIKSSNTKIKNNTLSYENGKVDYKIPTNADGKKEKDTSVIGSAVVGSIIAGPVGGVVGAIHAADKNNRNKRS